MATDLATGLSDAAHAELLDRASERGFVLASELANLRDPIAHWGAAEEDLLDEVADLGVPVIDDRAGGPPAAVTLGLPGDPVRQYLNQAAQFDLLDAEREQDLAKRYEAGTEARRLLAEQPLAPLERERLARVVADGQAARERLIRSNLRLVIPTAKKYAGRDLPMLEAIQEGNLGLIEAVERFDYTKGYKFSTYAVWWIRKALQRGLSKRGRVVRIPSTMWEQVGRLRRAEEAIRVRQGREPTVEEVAEESGIDAGRVRDIRQAMRPITSLDLPVGEEGDISLGDLLPDLAVVDPERDTTVADLRARLIGSLLDLDERQRAILELRYGLRDGETRTLAEVGEELGLSRERVRQLEKEALVNLRDPATAQGLNAVFDALAA